MKEALQAAGTAADKLRKFDIYHPNISLFVDRPDPSDPSTSPTDIDIYIAAKERGRIALKTGTDLGNTEGSAYGNLLLRNLFGGAESLSINASAGTRTRSSYTATFDTPILSNPDLRLSFDGFASSTQKPWASHEEVLKGGNARFRWIGGDGAAHEVRYTGAWRQVTALAGNASPSVRKDAGDSVKSSVSHTYALSRLNHPFLPTSGFSLKSVSEIAGFGIGGDVAFWKSEMETSGAVGIPLPGKSKEESGVSLTAGLRGGAIYPINGVATRINDRFQLGGPTDVRGFSMGGLGPRDGPDAMGGDVFAAGSINLLMPFPRCSAETPLRFQLFANGGRLLAMKRKEGESPTSAFYRTIGKLGDGLPSTAVGFGVVYAHPVARFEVNFGIPLIKRQGEEARKGIQFGVGINFM